LDELDSEVLHSCLNDRRLDQVQTVLNSRKEHLPKFEFDPKSRATRVGHFNYFEGVWIVKNAQSIIGTAWLPEKLDLLLYRNRIMPVGGRDDLGAKTAIHVIGIISLELKSLVP